MIKQNKNLKNLSKKRKGSLNSSEKTFKKISTKEDFFLDLDDSDRNAEDASDEDALEAGPQRNIVLENPKESAEQKRLRLAKEYLLKIGTEVDEEGSGNSDGETEDAIGHRLANARLEALGRGQKQLAGALAGVDLSLDKQRFFRGHKLSPTCLAMTSDDTTVFSGSKDNSIIRWDVETGQKQFLRPMWSPSTNGKKSHHGEILAVAVSSDGKFLAAGGRDRLVRIYDTRSNKQLEAFPGHKDAVSALAFRIDSHSLYSASHDRCVNHWNIDEMGYVETLFGHQSFVNDIDSLRQEKAVTASGDRTMRLWKIVEESQLIFKGHSASIDCLRLITEDWFVSGGQDGGLGLWFTLKKKPACFVENAHGPGHWITALGSARGSDLIASGSDSGCIKLWQVQTEERTVKEVNSIPVAGFVNGIAFSSSGSFLVAAIGQEHKLGRWCRHHKAKNGIFIAPLEV